MSEDQEVTGNTENKKVGVLLFIGIPTVFVIIGIITLIFTFTDTFNSGSNTSGNSETQNAIEYAKTFNFRADIHTDVSVLKVVISADTSPGPENLFLDLLNKADKKLFYQVRLFNSGNNVYRGTLPGDIEYGEWAISLYPENKIPVWRIDDESIFPNNIVSIAAK